MYLLFGIIFLIVVGAMGISESYAQSNMKQYDFDGAVSSFGCITIEGIIVDIQVDNLGLQKVCKFHDQFLRIVDYAKLCAEALSQWTDPYTDKTYTFPSLCDNPKFCNDVSFSPHGSEYVQDESVNMDYHVIDLGGAYASSHGSICYQTISSSYQRIQNTFHISTEGQWTENIFEITIPHGLYNNDIHVFVNDEEIEFIETSYDISYDKFYPKYITTITFPLEPTTAKHDIKIMESPFYDKRFNWNYLVTDELKNELNLLINDTPNFSLIDNIDLFTKNRLEIIREIDKELNERGVYILESAEIVGDGIQTILIDDEKSGMNIIDDNQIDVNPWSFYPSTSVRITDIFGNSLSSITVGQQVQISDDLANSKDTEQSFVYLVQIKDDEGVTVSLAWISGMLSPGQSFSPSISWIPDTDGTYFITTFVWDSISNPTPLRISHSLHVTVEKQDTNQ